MKKLILLTCSSLILSSCSSIDRSMIYSGLVGAVVGGLAGRALSPDHESDKYNTTLGVGVGAAAGAALGAYFFNSDPDNKNMKTMLDPSQNKDRNQTDFDIGIPISEKFYTVTPDTSNVPAHLKDKVKKQVIIEKVLPERVIPGEGGKTTLIPESRVIEINYE